MCAMQLKNLGSTSLVDGAQLATEYMCDTQKS